MVSPGIKRAFNEGLQAAIPDGGLTISKWASQYRFVERSAFPGKWSNDRVPFLTEIMDVITEPDIREVVFMKSSQVGGSELAMNTIGYFMHMDPTYIMYLGEQEDKVRAFANESFDATVRVTPALQNIVNDDPADDNQRVKRFPGGQLTFAWATSPAQLSSRPVRVLIMDENDAYVVTKEGNASKLAEARQKTFMGTEKRLKISSPRNAETSNIEPAYLAGDQREFYVPCPHCNEFQTLKWANLKWPDGEPELAAYLCEVCELMIDHDEKQDMLSKGRWIAGAETKHIASFKISELYSPFTTWADMAEDFLKAKKHKDTLRVFVNTRLGETWKDEETIEYEDLTLHKEDYDHEVPDGGLLLTAGVDIQADRIELEVVGWGVDRENWSIDKHVLYGDPELPAVWEDLEGRLTHLYRGSQREFRISAVAIDSGYHTNVVMAFCRKFRGRRWFPVKGLSTPGNPIVKKGSKDPHHKISVWTVGTDTAKDEVFAFLRVDQPGTPGFCHFPNDDRYDESYLKQLCSEKRASRFKMGREYHIYEKLRAGIRNEALDIRVYATAARAIIVPKFDEWAARESAKRIKTASSTVNAPSSAARPQSEPSAEVSRVTADDPDAVENPVENTPEQPKRRIRSFRSSRF
jgi:phage terminase large subunit GpA-like protein